MPPASASRTSSVSIPAAPLVTRPSTAPSSRATSIGERAAPDRTPQTGLLTDVVSALLASEAGRGILEIARAAFVHRRFDLYRALSLYDTGRGQTLSLPSFLSAMVSAGLKLSHAQHDTFTRAIVAGVAAVTGAHAAAHDITVDYRAFFDALFQTSPS